MESTENQPDNYNKDYKKHQQHTSYNTYNSNSYNNNNYYYNSYSGGYGNKKGNNGPQKKFYGHKYQFRNQYSYYNKDGKRELINYKIQFE